MACMSAANTAGRKMQLLQAALHLFTALLMDMDGAACMETTVSGVRERVFGLAIVWGIGGSLVGEPRVR